MENYNFFDHLSANYDEMINIEKSIEKKRKSLYKFLDQNYKTALDLGCGTGADSIALSQLGLKVTAVDQSSGMLKTAKVNAENYKTPIEFIKTDLTELTIKDKRFDLIVSLGNTLANLPKQKLQIVFNKLPEILSSNGKIIIQLINFSRLPPKGKYLLNKYSNELIEIIREYEIHNDYIDFIITKIKRTEGKSERIITKIYPHSDQLIRNLSNDNDLHVAFFGNLAKDAYILDKSDNLVAVISK